MFEEWRPIEGTYGRYEVSNTGKIRSTNYLGHKITKELSLCPDNKGYLRVRIYKGEYRATVKVHREVAKAFIDNPLNKPEVNHKDGNKQNNHVDNLEWCTASENTKHAYANGLKEKTKEWCKKMGKSNKGTDIARKTRGTPLIATNINTGEQFYFNSQAEAAEKLHIPQPNISKVLLKQRHSVHGYTIERTDKGR